MAQTTKDSRGLRDGVAVRRADLDVTNAGFAVQARSLAGPGIIITSTGPDTGTGDVTYSLGQFNARTPGASPATLLASDGIVYMGFAAANVLKIQTQANATAGGAAYATEQVVNVIQTDIGKTQITYDSGVTIIAPGSMYCRTKGSVLTLKRMGSSDTWIVTGDTDDATSGGGTAARFKATGGSSVGSSFSTITLTTTAFNVGSFVLNSNSTITAPLTGKYDCTGSLRVPDYGSTYNVGIGIGTVNADSTDFYWDTVTSSSGGANRKTFQYHNIINFNSGDFIRLFAYVDGTTLALNGGIVLNYLG